MLDDRSGSIAWDSFRTLVIALVFSAAKAEKQSSAGCALSVITAPLITKTCERLLLMNEKNYNVLFLCTGNSARSILAEGILNTLGKGRFRAYSAGSFPKGTVNPLAIETLQNSGHDVSGLRSKSWDEFAGPDAPQMDFIFTVCDAAAGETCPVWPGHPVTAHWGFADPSHVKGDEAMKRAAFSKTYHEIAQRIRLFLNLPIERLDRMSLQTQLHDLGKTKE